MRCGAFGDDRAFPFAVVLVTFLATLRFGPVLGNPSPPIRLGYRGVSRGTAPRAPPGRAGPGSFEEHHAVRGFSTTPAEASRRLRDPGHDRLRPLGHPPSLDEQSGAAVGQATWSSPSSTARKSTCPTSPSMNQKRQTGQPLHVLRRPVRRPQLLRRDLTRAELVDALILEHEADRLGIPGTRRPSRRDWIEQQT